MALESAAELQEWIDRLNAGDKSARDELIRHACARLRGLVGKMMQKYDRLERWVDIDDVLQNAVVRLLPQMGSTTVTSVQEFFSLAALQIRRELIDLCRHYFGPQGVGANHESAQVAGSPEDDWRPLVEPVVQGNQDQQELAFWKDFHLLIERLPAGERCVFDLVWYHGMTQTEASLVLGLSEAKVKRLWFAAQQLKTALGGRLPD